MPSIMSVSLLLLSLSACFLSVLSVPTLYADRAFRGWEPWTISANKANQSALIIDSGVWVKIIHEGGRPGPPGPPHLAAPADPSISSFNLTAYNTELELIAAGQMGHAWLLATRYEGRSGRSDYLIYADLMAQTVLLNISVASFSPKVGGYGIEGIAVNSKDYVFAVQGNNVWTFDLSGKQANYFALSGSSAPIVSIDIDAMGSLWILEDFNSSTQVNRLMQYSDSGELIGTNALNFTDIKYQDWLIDLAVDSQGNAYIAAVGENRILSWSTMNGTRGRDLRLQGRPGDFGIDYYWPQLALVNDSMIFVAEYNLPEIQVVDIHRGGRSHNINSPSAVLEGPFTINMDRDGLIVEFDHSYDNQAVALSPRDGSLEFAYGQADPNQPRGFVSGLAVDFAGQVYVSEDVYLNKSFHQFVHVYGRGQRGPYDHSIEVTSAGPLAFDPISQLIWVADDISQRGAVVLSAYNVKYGGSPVKVANFTQTAGIPYIADFKILSTRNNVTLIVADFVNNQLVAVTDSGKHQGQLPLASLSPLAFAMGFDGYTYVVGVDFKADAAYVGVYAGNGTLVEVLYPPPGWEGVVMAGVTVDDFSGTVYATVHDFNAILTWDRPHHGPNRTVAVNTWFGDEKQVQPQTSVNLIKNVAPVVSSARPSLDSLRPHRCAEASRRRR